MAAHALYVGQTRVLGCLLLKSNIYILLGLLRSEE